MLVYLGVNYLVYLGELRMCIINLLPLKSSGICSCQRHRAAAFALLLWELTKETLV